VRLILYGIFKWSRVESKDGTTQCDKFEWTVFNLVNRTD